MAFLLGDKALLSAYGRALSHKPYPRRIRCAFASSIIPPNLGLSLLFADRGKTIFYAELFIFFPHAIDSYYFSKV